MGSPAPAKQPAEITGPERSPHAIRAVLVRYAEPDVVAEYDTAFDAALEAARETQRLDALHGFINRWWLIALAWQRDPAGERLARRELNARVHRYLTESLPPREERMSRQQFIDRYITTRGE